MHRGPDEVWGAAAALHRAGEAGVYVLVVGAAGHTPRSVGARMLVTADGHTVGTIGGGALERVVLEQAADVMATGRPRTVSHKLKAELGMCCGGSMEIYMEPIAARPSLILFGAGHVGQATARFALATDFRVLVCDDRSELNTPERFGESERDTRAPLDALAALTPGPMDAVVVTTHDHELDKQLVAASLCTEAGYVGMIGSSRKADSTRRYLALAGLSDADVAAVHMPIGLDIAAETPAEIGLAIVGELVRWRRLPRSVKRTHGAAVGSLGGPLANLRKG